MPMTSSFYVNNNHVYTTDNTWITSSITISPYSIAGWAMPYTLTTSTDNAFEFTKRTEEPKVDFFPPRELINNFTGKFEYKGAIFWYKNGELHRDEKEGEAVLYPGQKKLYYWNGKLHRWNGPASENANRSNNNLPVFDGKHNLDFYSIHGTRVDKLVRTGDEGKKLVEEKYTGFVLELGNDIACHLKDGLFHNINGQAYFRKGHNSEAYFKGIKADRMLFDYISYSFEKEVAKRDKYTGSYIVYNNDKSLIAYFKNGELIKEINDNGCSWYKDDLFHREDGPAIELDCGTKYWYKEGKLHREDGPAIETFDGKNEWFLNDENIASSKETFEYRLKLYKEKQQNNNKGTNKKIMDTQLVKETLKTDMSNTAYRVAANKTVKLLRAFIVEALSTKIGLKGAAKKNFLEKTSELLNSPYGDALISVMIGSVLPLVKEKIPANLSNQSEKLAEEFRVRGMTVIGDEITEFLTGPAFAMLSSGITTLLQEVEESDSTSEKVRVQVSAATENNEEVVQEKTTSQKNLKGHSSSVVK